MSSEMSESVEMYLLRIALLQEQTPWVPISVLADELSVSPVSANQMCRRLENKEMVEYQPYKGVQLTPAGEEIAMRVLRKRRLWEVFLADKLNIEPKEAEEMACRFEHVTPDLLANRLAGFLGNPTVSPQREPIPVQAGEAVRRPRRPLTTLLAGEQGQIADIHTGDTVRDFVHAQGVSPGTIVKVIAGTARGSILLEAAGDYLSLAHDVAAQIDVSLLNTTAFDELRSSEERSS
jgi:DtxR family Mn-dependent transcriptional regulator